jgi:hypothetical protein
MNDALEVLERCASLVEADEARLLVSTLNEREYDRLGALLDRWRSGGPRPTRDEIRGCLDGAGEAEGR